MAGLRLLLHLSPCSAFLKAALAIELRLSEAPTTVRAGVALAAALLAEFGAANDAWEHQHTDTELAPLLPVRLICICNRHFHSPLKRQFRPLSAVSVELLRAGLIIYGAPITGCSRIFVLAERPIKMLP
jgi:hypothetical protein